MAQLWNKYDIKAFPTLLATDSAGHLALGIGKAAGATLTLIPEEFPKPLRLKTIVDTLVGNHQAPQPRPAGWRGNDC
jgi:hypothetical protein